MFKQYDRVKIVDGPYAGRVGLVMRVSLKARRICVAAMDNRADWGYALCKPEDLKLLKRARAVTAPTLNPARALHERHDDLRIAGLRKAVVEPHDL